MTMINPTPETNDDDVLKAAADAYIDARNALRHEPLGATISDMSEADKLRIDLQSAQSINASNHRLLAEQRDKQNKLFRLLNEAISEGDCSESDEISFGDLSFILEQAYGEGLEFLKTFDVEVEWTVRASLQIKAKDDTEARYIAEDISFDEPDLDIDDDTTEIDSIDIDAEGVRTCREQ